MPLTTRPTLNFLKSVNTLTDDENGLSKRTTVPENRPDKDVHFQSYAFDKSLDSNRYDSSTYGGMEPARRPWTGDDEVCSGRFKIVY
jgi:hypothetical protein